MAESLWLRRLLWACLAGLHQESGREARGQWMALVSQVKLYLGPEADHNT